MRIISGEFRGRKIISPLSRDIRPTSDRVRESVFNIARGRIGGARVLDLFAGSGAVGLEFSGRGAEFVVFADKSPESVAAVNANIAAFKIPPSRRRVIKGDYAFALRLLRGEKFDIIYIDPPYKSGLVSEAAGAVFARGLPSENGVVIIERDSREPLDIPAGAVVSDERAYGRTVLTFMVKADERQKAEVKGEVGE